MHNFKELIIWKKSRISCSDTYVLTSKFPSNEKFGITNQLRRCVVLIPSNIAEYSSRNFNNDFSKFLEIALVSAYVIEKQLLISFDLGFITKSVLDEISLKIEEITKKMSKFRSSLKI